MAFEQINKYTDTLKEAILKSRKNDEENPGKHKDAYAEQRSIFNCLLDYYETVLSTGKFSGQRQYCKKVMEELEPAFCKGYFSTKKVKA